MSEWQSLILQWGTPITQVVLLCMQIYTYRRTRHWSLALIVSASVLGLVALALSRILNAEQFVPALSAWLIDAMIVSYVAYIVMGVGGAAALFRSYTQLTDAKTAANRSHNGASSLEKPFT
jgi:hypothetical protein